MDFALLGGRESVKFGDKVDTLEFRKVQLSMFFEVCLSISENDEIVQQLLPTEFFVKSGLGQLSQTLCFITKYDSTQ